MTRERYMTKRKLQRVHNVPESANIIPLSYNGQTVTALRPIDKLFGFHFSAVIESYGNGEREILVAENAEFIEWYQASKPRVTIYDHKGW